MKRLKVFGDKKEIIEKIKQALESGKVLVLPTDTVYGLVYDSQNENAVRKIFEIKNRPLNKPIGIFVKDIEMAKKIAQINKGQEKLLKKNWPGKFTFVLKKKHYAPRRCSVLISKFVGTKEIIGIRIPDYELIQDLFKEINFPLAQTSVNISGRPALTRIQKIIKQFEDQQIGPNMVADAGDLSKSKPSTVIDLTTKKPQILRQV
jgi:L-threonylcarbamoyladenylate synthase